MTEPDSGQVPHLPLPDDVEHQPMAEPDAERICLAAAVAMPSFRDRPMRASRPLFGT